MANIIVVMDTDDNHKEMLTKAAGSSKVLFKKSDELTSKELSEADIIIGNISPECLPECRNLKLLQLNSAGTDGYTTPGVLPKGAKLSNATGAYGLAISEHMIGMLLCGMKKLDKYILHQQTGDWKDDGSVTSIYNSQTLVVGLGDIGSEFAKRMHALGSSVTGLKRTVTSIPSYMDNVYTMDKLLSCLPNADIVATCLPGNSETYKLFNKEAFDQMKTGAYFINVGRGNSVDTDALIDALNSGKLAGAMLDVTDPEPLPKEHRLWSTPGVIITPHVSGGYHLKETHNRIVAIAAKNIEHLLKNEPFDNLVL